LRTTLAFAAIAVSSFIMWRRFSKTKKG